jgi:hypothetical protein
VFATISRCIRPYPAVHNFALCFHCYCHCQHAEIVPISAARDQGIPQLLAALLRHLSPGGPKYYASDTVTTRDERFFASEIVRECLLKLYRVRHNCCVPVASTKPAPFASEYVLVFRSPVYLTSVVPTLE